MRTLFLLFLAVPLLAVVVIKPREVGETPGISGAVSGAFETRRGNTEKDNYAASLQLQYDSNASSLVWGELRGEYGESGGARDTNNLFSHLRYIRNLFGRNTAGELFGQLEKDEFKSINIRALAGGGMRWKVLNKGTDAWGGLFAGLGIYAEYIGYATRLDPVEHNGRFNGYLAYALPFRQGGSFTAAAYYQPKVDNGSDCYVSVSARLELPIYRQLFLAFGIGYNYDAEPALGVKKDDIEQRTLFTYKF